MFAFGKLSVKYQRDWIEAVQRRVTATSSVLDNMKGIKMSGLSDVFNSELQQLRVLELAVSSKFRQIIAFFAVLSNFSGATIPILTLIIYVLVTRATTGWNLIRPWHSLQSRSSPCWQPQSNNLLMPSSTFPPRLVAFSESRNTF